MEQNSLRVTIVQSNLFWEDKVNNIKQFTNKIFEVELGSTDLVVLPEMFATGFTMNSKRMAEKMDGFVVNWMKEIAQVRNIAICGSMIIEENNQFFNRFLFVEASGKVSFYDKSHLFRMANENKHFEKGKNTILIDYKGWKIAPFVCYDIRFPVWLKRTPNFDYDLMLVVANWPEKRILHWQVLNQARAIENQCYVAAVNRVGEDGNELVYNGQSCIYNPQGKLLNEPNNEVFEETIELHLPELKTYRKAFPVSLDDDLFEIKF
jgi:predicted amidohydrolase